jgi:hypothetical protein
VSHRQHEISRKIPSREISLTAPIWILCHFLRHKCTVACGRFWMGHALNFFLGNTLLRGLLKRFNSALNIGKFFWAQRFAVEPSVPVLVAQLWRRCLYYRRLVLKFFKMVPLVAFTCVLESARQREKFSNWKSFSSFKCRVWSAIFHKIFILQQCQDPDPNPNFFRIRIQPIYSDSFGFGSTTLPTTLPYFWVRSIYCKTV